MNNIKFRAYLKITNEMVNVKSINFENSTIKYNNPSTGITMCAGFENIELMQAINLTDKNGTEIYEGDIIDIHETVNGQNLFVITFGKLKVLPTYLCGEEYEYNILDLLDWYTRPDEVSIEVIGNIYESHDLLWKYIRQS